MSLFLSRFFLLTIVFFFLSFPFASSLSFFLGRVSFFPMSSGVCFWGCVFCFSFSRRPGVARSALSGLLRLRFYRSALFRPALLALPADTGEYSPSPFFQTELLHPSLSARALLPPLVCPCAVPSVARASPLPPFSLLTCRRGSFPAWRASQAFPQIWRQNAAARSGLAFFIFLRYLSGATVPVAVLDMGSLVLVFLHP